MVILDIGPHNRSVSDFLDFGHVTQLKLENAIRLFIHFPLKYKCVFYENEPEITVSQMGAINNSYCLFVSLYICGNLNVFCHSLHIAKVYIFLLIPITCTSSICGVI